MRQALEEMYPIVEEVDLDEAKYELYHKDFSSAMQHAYHVAKKHHGITIDPKEIDDKVATGPSKPSEGKTNKYRLKGDKGAVQIQVYNKGGSKPFELNMYKEEVELHEKEITLFKSMQPTAYDRMRRRMNPKDIKTVDASDEKQIKDLESRGWIRNPWDEEVDLGEEWTIVMPPAEGGKTVTGLDSMQVFSFVKSKGGKDRDMQSIKKGKNVTFQGKTGAFYKVIKEGLGVAEEVDLDEGGMKDLLIKAQELMGPSKNRKEGIQMVAKGLKVSEKEATKLVDAVIKMNEELAKIKGKTPGDEGRRSAVEDDIERAEKKGDKKEVEKLKEEDEIEEAFSVEVPKQSIDGKTYGGGASVIVKAKSASHAIKMVAKRLKVDWTALKTGEIVKEEVDLDEGKMKKGDTVTVLIGPHKGDKHEIIHDFGDGTYNVRPIRVPKIKYKLGAVKAKASDLKKEELDLDEAKKKPVSQMTPKEKEADAARRKEYKAYQKSKRNEEDELEEGKMSQLHQYIKDKKSAEEIAKLMKVDVKTIKALMSSYESTDGDNMGENSKYMEMLAAACGAPPAPKYGSVGESIQDEDEVEEGAAADARRAMKKDKDFSRRDRADDDNSATDDDVKAASKNIMMQMRKVVSMKGDFTVEFGDKKKVKIPVKVAQVVQQKYNSMKRPADKEKFQAQVAKSYKDMLKVLKAGYHEELKPQKESILDRIDKKLKERKNG